MTTYYTTRGSVRGDCGHQHASITEATHCQEQDTAGCERQGGYSDRRVYVVEPDGSHRPPTDAEWDQAL